MGVLVRPTELLVLLPFAAAGDRINLKEPQDSWANFPDTGFFHEDVQLQFVIVRHLERV
jgi:hypothetical protein